MTLNGIQVHTSKTGSERRDVKELEPSQINILEKTTKKQKDKPREKGGGEHKKRENTTRARTAVTRGF